MKRVGVVLLGLSVGCASLDADRRVERGPALRTETREHTLGERVTFASVETSWPQLTLRFSTADICRTEQHTQYTETVVTQRRTTPAAAAVSTGGILTAVGGFLVIGRSLFSDKPNRDTLDEDGHYGASSRKVATGWGVGVLIVGVPALVTGIIQLATAKEERETRPADELTALREVPCQPAPAEGQVTLSGPLGPVVEPRATQQGQVTFSAHELQGREWTAVQLDAAPVLLMGEGQTRLELFRACLPWLTSTPDAQRLVEEARLVPERLRSLRQLIRGCSAIPGAPTGPWLQAMDAALETPSPGAGPTPQAPSPASPPPP
ncbi:hypothetical protein KRR26_26030 [Corallococcus sp. M34]|uniref:hypothetical protein n=1 Tax=Citreicoccus inhibens TaxID=2849499 RepID=UPI001C24CD1F|nr:hypothetical protein [Citreicoccus inhibens]MBU8899076.1 hypothetical protein [Citreicoccus inhibens]